MEHEELNINWKTGHMMIVMDRFFPCSVKDLNFLLNKCICLDWEHEGDIIKQIEDHCIRGIAETEEYKRILPQMEAETREDLAELCTKVATRERIVEGIKADRDAAKGKEKKQLSEVLKKAKEDLKSVQAHRRNTEAKVRDYARKYEESDRLIEKYKKNLEILKQRK